MATQLMSPRTARPTFKPPTEVAAAALAKTNGSLTGVPNGRLIRVSSSDVDWDVSRPWTGREIQGWKVRKSLWNKMLTVSFYVALTSTPQGLAVFTLSLTPPLTDEEIELAANTYMTLLNMAREGG